MVAVDRRLVQTPVSRPDLSAVLADGGVDLFDALHPSIIPGHGWLPRLICRHADELGRRKGRRADRREKVS